MPDKPWTKFYWNDWRGEPTLRLCSVAARGLWMDMLCVAAESDPVGYVMVAGKPLDIPDLCRVSGESPELVKALLDELRRHQVFGVTRKGIIYSRRMVKETKLAASSIEAGNKGGNPLLRRGTVPKRARVRPFRRSDNPAKTRRIFDRGNGLCHWCKCELVFESPELVPNLFHVDHVVPVSDGGTNDENNLVSACASCNHSRARNDWINPPDTNPDAKPSCARHLESRVQSPERDSPNGERQSAKQIAESMIEIWNREAGPAGLRTVVKLTQTRQRTCNARLREDFAGNFDEWRSSVRRVVGSSFLLGNNATGFRATFDWVISPSNITKIIEGNYDERTGKGANGRTVLNDAGLLDGPTEPPPTLAEFEFPMGRAH